MPQDIFLHFHLWRKHEYNNLISYINDFKKLDIQF